VLGASRISVEANAGEIILRVPSDREPSRLERAGRQQGGQPLKGRGETTPPEKTLLMLIGVMVGDAIRDS
jgi:hypothetical protein